jgi:hypothetical protein
MVNIRALNRNVHEIKHTYKAGWEQWYLLQSDHHRDNPKCQDEMLLKHLKEAQERKAGILMFGDYFCCMQGKYDKRHSKADLRPEHQVKDYFDALVRTETDFLAPFAENICVIGYGNHETSIIKRQETDLIARLVESLNNNVKPKKPVYAGGYGGYVKFTFGRGAEGNSNKQSILMKYRHSGGSLGEISKGTLGVDRMAKAFPDADIIVSGDNHESWTMEITQERINGQGKIEHKDQLHIKLPTYKEEYGDGFMGFHVERNAPPKPLGAYWLRFFYDAASDSIKYEVTRAK